MSSLKPLASLLTLCLMPLASQASGTLVGWASLPAATFAGGPTSGQFIGAGPFNDGHVPPFQQPVQGFSAILNGPAPGTYYVMADNGYGAKGNSADTLLRMYAVRVDWASRSVLPVSFTDGSARTAFTPDTYITLRDPDGKLGYKITAEFANYPNGANNIPVDAGIAAGRLLTGYDLDPESVRQDKNGNFWFGDDFGPFLVKTDAQGKVLRQEIPLPGVMAPQNPYLGSATPNLPTSRGFEGMALNAAGTRLYTLLEGTVTGDPARSLRINEFDLASEAYTGFQAFYRLDPQAAAIGDFTAVDAHRYLVIERDNGQGATAQFKRVFLADLSLIDADGFVAKTEVLDLMNIADPDDLNGDGSTLFSFPFVTIESVLVVDAHTLLITNDNNFPFSAGRAAGIADNDEFILVRLAQPVPEPETWAMLLAGLGLVGWMARRRRG
jgi:hypothetical protein